MSSALCAVRNLQSHKLSWRNNHVTASDCTDRRHVGFCNVRGIARGSAYPGRKRAGPRSAHLCRRRNTEIFRIDERRPPADRHRGRGPQGMDADLDQLLHHGQTAMGRRNGCGGAEGRLLQRVLRRRTARARLATSPVHTHEDFLLSSIYTTAFSITSTRRWRRRPHRPSASV